MGGIGEIDLPPLATPQLTRGVIYLLELPFIRHANATAIPDDGQAEFGCWICSARKLCDHESAAGTIPDLLSSPRARSGAGSTARDRGTAAVIGEFLRGGGPEPERFVAVDPAAFRYRVPDQARRRAIQCRQKGASKRPPGRCTERVQSFH